MKRGAFIGQQQHGIMTSSRYILCSYITDLFICTRSVAELEPESFGRIRMRFGSELTFWIRIRIRFQNGF
jgi:hypothetical protein